jgi:hypothetical protein
VRDTPSFFRNCIVILIRDASQESIRLNNTHIGDLFRNHLCEPYDWLLAVALTKMYAKYVDACSFIRVIERILGWTRAAGPVVMPRIRGTAPECCATGE